jgi:hypothetical protein
VTRNVAHCGFPDPITGELLKNDAYVSSMLQRGSLGKLIE